MSKYEHKVQYYETDQMGIVHHSNYIRWFEEARVDFLDQAGLPYKEVEQRGYESPVIGVQCSYKSPARFGDVAVVEVTLLEFGNLKYRFAYRVWDRTTQAVFVTGESEHCFIDETGKLISLRRSDPALFEKMSGFVQQSDEA